MIRPAAQPSSRGADVAADASRFGASPEMPRRAAFSNHERRDGWGT